MSTGVFLTNGRWAIFPQGYSYGDGHYCPDCILPAIGLVPGPLDAKASVESLLELVANQRGIDYSDEYSYDDDVFPKAITQLSEPEPCSRCNVNLLEV